MSKSRVSKAVKKYVSNKLESELESRNVIQNATMTATVRDTGVIFQSCPIANGNNIFDRTALVISPYKYTARCWMTATISSIVRCLLVSFTQQSTTTLPAVVDILQAATAGNVLAPISTFANVAVSNGDFRVLHDHIEVLDAGRGLESSFTVKLRDKQLPSKIHYQGTASTDIGKNVMAWIFVSNIPAAAAEPDVYLSEQLYYKDG